ncbi:MAG: c-type cytochrome [Fuerstiella sp.]|nr:c-type cytochrome [Fuerstiella sp.]
MRCILCAVILVCGGHLPADTKPLEKPVATVDSTRQPDAALGVLDTPDDLEATLVAAEPTLLSPSTIDIDSAGRIWVAEVVNYRRHANKDRKDREAGDRILVLQDTDGDGSVDSSHTYYQGRDIDSAHGICVLGNRVIVSALDSVINFYDDDGDLVADRKEVMFTGIQGVQHDHGIHSFTSGPDGRLYFNFGNEAKELHRPDGTIVTDIAGKPVRADRTPYQQGMAFRCDPDGSNVETLGWNFRNNWELTIDSFGTIWQSDNDDDGNRATRINFVMEYGNYGYRDEVTGARWKTPRTGMEAEIPLQHWHLNDPGVIPNVIITGAGAPCGIEVYEGSLLPKRFRNQLLHCDAGVNVVRSYEVSADGAGYQASINPVLYGTRDLWFRPCDVATAADGSLIIADWYDPGVGGHRQGDIDRGRLFRIAPNGTPWRHPTFEFESIDGAVNGLLSCNRDARYQGWQRLAKAGSTAEPQLQQIFQKHRNPRFRARALWLLARLPGRTEHYLTAAAHDPNPDIRIVALRAARQLQIALPETVKHLITDTSPAVRRECAIALCNLPPESRAALWVPLAQTLDAEDRWFLEALGIAAHGIWNECLAGLLQSSESAKISADVADAIIWRSRANNVTPALIGERISALSTDPDSSPSDLARWFRALDFQSSHGLAEHMPRLLDSSYLRMLKPEMASFVVSEALARIQPGQLSEETTASDELKSALNHLEPGQRIALVEKFRIHSSYPELVQIIIAAPDSQDAVSSVASLLNLDQKQLITSVANSESAESATAALKAIGNSRNAAFTYDLLQLVDNEDTNPEVRRAAIRAGMRILSVARQLIVRTEDNRIEGSLRQTVAAALHGSPEQELRNIGNKMFPLSDAKAGEKLSSVSELMDRRGDPQNGRLIYNTTGTCHKCHVVNNIGRNLGPDLSEIGRKLSRQAMLESVLFPSAGISHNYDTWTLLLANGTTLTGLISSETDDSITLIDNEARMHTVSTADIEEKIRQSVSLMPADLQKIMSSQELVDVVAYLQTLKKAAE